MMMMMIDDDVDDDDDDDDDDNKDDTVFVLRGLVHCGSPPPHLPTGNAHTDWLDELTNPQLTTTN
jgi:hypothetical protein